jgi:hypothetical protein
VTVVNLIIMENIREFYSTLPIRFCKEKCRIKLCRG